MRPSIYWLKLPEACRLAIMPRPRAGDWLLDEIAGWKSEGINVVVSLLEQHEVDELELQQEPRVCLVPNPGSGCPRVNAGDPTPRSLSLSCNCRWKGRGYSLP